MKKYVPFLAISFVVCSLFLNMVLLFRERTTTDSPVPSSNEQYPLLMPFVNNISQEDRIINFLPLRRDLQQFIATQSPTLGMYFEYIPTGVWIGINEKEPYLYASLLKVPLAMAIYEGKNQNKLKLTDIKTITEEMMDPEYGTLWQKGPGTKISIQEGLEKALIESDNTAYNVLKSAIPLTDFANVFDFLDIPLEIQGNEPAVTPKNYISIFRSLVYASFLPPEDSEQILETLSHSSYTQGIRASIPDTIRVAHKMGIRKNGSYLSDCGVIYHPTRPYFLCIMDKQQSILDSEKTMRQISQKIYTYISNK